MRNVRMIRGLALALAFLAIAAGPALGKDEAKKPAAGPLEVTYYYLPG
jgi:hypothetical protein